jgi:O-antigen/teichoic acid export membrane protein
MVLLYLHLRVDMFVVKSVVGTEALGQYSLTVSLAEAFMLVTDSLATVLLSRQLSGGLREAANSALAGARAVALFGVVALLGWGALGSPAIRLAFGSEFLPAFQPLMLLLPGIVLLGMQRMCGGTVLMAGRPWTLTSLQSLAFALNLGLNLWWVPRFGLSGAALASTLSYAVLAAAVLAWTIRLAEVRPTAVIPGPGDLNRLWTELRFRRHPKPIEYGR